MHRNELQMFKHKQLINIQN